MADLNCDWCGGEGCRDCDKDIAQNENEAAYERYLEDFYGGSGPLTEMERYQKSAEEKRRLG